jgi:hypothetical protein
MQYACIHCDKYPLSRALRGKIGYIGHRHFLPKDHAWRRSLAFVQLDKVKHVRPVKHPTPRSRKRKRGEDGGPKIFSRKVLLWMLPYWKDWLLPYNLDVMHIEKNICENILGTLLEILGKTKDTDNARLDLHDMGIRHDLHLQQDGN